MSCQERRGIATAASPSGGGWEAVARTWHGKGPRRSGALWNHMLQFREEGVLVRSVVLDLVFGIDDIIAAALAFVTAAAFVATGRSLFGRSLIDRLTELGCCGFKV